MTHEAFILIVDGLPLSYTETDNEDQCFCVGISYDLVTWADKVWMVATAEEAFKALEANQSGPKPVPWYNADYGTPSIPKSLVDRVQVAKAECEFTVKYDPMPILSYNIISYEILEKGGS